MLVPPVMFLAAVAFWKSRPADCPLPTWEVRKMESSQTTGVDEPKPSRGAFQAMFSVGPQRIGIPFSWEVPSARGPRHCGQLSAHTADDTITKVMKKKTCFCIHLPFCCRGGSWPTEQPVPFTLTAWVLYNSYKCSYFKEITLRPLPRQLKCSLSFDSKGIRATLKKRS